MPVRRVVSEGVVHIITSYFVQHDCSNPAGEAKQHTSQKDSESMEHTDRKGGLANVTLFDVFARRQVIECGKSSTAKQQRGIGSAVGSEQLLTILTCIAVAAARDVEKVRDI